MMNVPPVISDKAAEKPGRYDVKLPELVAKNIDHFAGRTWLLPALVDWWHDSKQRVFLVTGDPGTGKSMLIAWLASHGPLPADATAKAQLQMLRKQVAAVHFCMAAGRTNAPQMFADNVVRQLTRNATSFGDALAASLADQGKILSIQNIGTLQEGGSTTGIAIGNLDLGALGGDEYSFDRLFSRPIQQLYADGYDRPLLLLVDALDEAQTYTGRVSLVELLSGLADLPQQVRILATTRDEPRVLKYFHAVAHPAPVDLVKSVPRDQDDVRLYVQERLKVITPPLSAEQADLLADRVSAASEGIFLYAHLVLSELLPHLPHVPDLKTYPLPKGLRGIYQDFLNRELAKGKEETRWHRTFKPLLGLIAVAQGEGLTQSQLKNMTRKNVGQTLRVCKQYLSGELPEGPFRLFHKSLSEYLLEDAGNIDYHIDAAEMHRSIAMHYWRQVHPAKKGRSKSVVDWSQCDSYCVQHLPAHLAEASDTAHLYELLIDFDFLATKCREASVYDLENDYREAVAIWPEVNGQREVLQALEESLRQAAHIISQSPDQLAGQLSGRLWDDPSPDVRNLLARAGQCQIGPWLRPLTASLREPPALLHTLNHHKNVVYGVAISEVQSTAVSASEDGTLIVWDLETGRKHRTLNGRHRAEYAVAIAPDGKTAVSATEDGLLEVWDLATGKEQQPPLRGHRGGAYCVAIAKNGQCVISDGEDKQVRVWDLGAGKERQPPLRGHKAAVSSVALSKDGRVISASYDGELKVWDLESGEKLKDFRGHVKRVNAVALSDDGRTAVSASKDKMLKVWDLETGKERLPPLRGHTGEVNGIAVFPDGRRAISASDDETLRIWDLDKGELLQTLRRHTSWVYQVALSPAGRIAVSASDDMSVRVWDLTRAEEQGLMSEHTSGVHRVVISSDGQSAISLSEDGELRAWNLVTRKARWAKRIHKGMVFGLAISSDGTTGFSGGKDKTVRVWDLIGGNENENGGLLRHDSTVAAVAVSHDGRTAVSATSKGALTVWDLAKREIAKSLSGHGGWVWGLAVAHNGRIVVSAGEDGNLKVWDLTSGRLQRTLPQHAGDVLDVAVSNDGRIAVSALEDGTLKVWNLDSGEIVHTLCGHTRWVYGVALAEDGRTAVSVSDDTTIKVWDIDRGKELTSFHLDGELYTVCNYP